MVRTTENFELFDKKWLTIFEKKNSILEEVTLAGSIFGC